MRSCTILAALILLLAGGPAVAADAVVATLDALEREFPGRYQAAPMLRDMASRGGRFYPVHGKPV